jgi:hypothetical protein
MKRMGMTQELDYQGILPAARRTHARNDFHDIRVCLLAVSRLQCTHTPANQLGMAGYGVLRGFNSCWQVLVFPLLAFAGFMILAFNLDQIKHNQEKQMAQIDDLNAAIDSLSADLTDVATNVSTVLQELKDAQSAGTPVDLSSAIAKLQTADASLKTIDQNLKDAEPQSSDTQTT